MIIIDIAIQKYQPVFSQKIGNRTFNIHNIIPTFQNSEKTNENNDSIKKNLYKVFSKYI